MYGRYGELSHVGSHVNNLAVDYILGGKIPASNIRCIIYLTFLKNYQDVFLLAERGHGHTRIANARIVVLREVQWIINITPVY